MSDRLDDEYRCFVSKYFGYGGRVRKRKGEATVEAELKALRTEVAGLRAELAYLRDHPGWVPPLGREMTPEERRDLDAVRKGFYRVAPQTGSEK